MAWDMIMNRAAGLSDLELGLRYKWDRTVFVSNIAYECKWPMLKDFMKDNVGEVTFCDVFEENGRSSGTAAVEFKSEEDARTAARSTFKHLNRKLSIFLDEDGKRTRRAAQQSVVAKVLAGKGSIELPPATLNTSDKDNNPFVEALAAAVSYGSDNRGSRRSPIHMRSHSYTREDNIPLADDSQSRLYTLLRRLGVEGNQLSDRVVVTNLDSRVDRQKIFDVFSLAGNILDISSSTNGITPTVVIQFDRVIDALQAIAMLDNQFLYERRMVVRLNSNSIPSSGSSMRLPGGLAGIGDRLDIEDLLLCKHAANVPLTRMDDRMNDLSSSRRKRSVNLSGSRMYDSNNSHNKSSSSGHQFADFGSSNNQSYSSPFSGTRGSNPTDIYEDLKQRLKQPRLSKMSSNRRMNKNGSLESASRVDPSFDARNFSNDRLRSNFFSMDRGNNQYLR